MPNKPAATQSRRKPSALAVASADLDALWAKIDALRNVDVEKRPANSFTTEEFSRRYGVAQTTARWQIGKMLRLGKLRKTVCWDCDSLGRVRKLIVFVPV